jgi:hypothetical protein
MKTILYWWREASILYHELALQSLCNSNPSHPDVPHIVMTINHLKAERITHAPF